MINQMKFQYNNFTISQVLEEAALESLPGIPSSKKMVMMYSMVILLQAVL